MYSVCILLTSSANQIEFFFKLKIWSLVVKKALKASLLAYQKKP